MQKLRNFKNYIKGNPKLGFERKFSYRQFSTEIRNNLRLLKFTIVKSKAHLSERSYRMKNCKFLVAR